MSTSVLPPRISVVIPAYNAAATLRPCIDSVLCQTFTDFELLIVDDGSTDESRLIGEEYCAKDDCVRLISQENRGRSAARWRGVEAAMGEWVCFMDADDRLQPNGLSALAVAADSGCDIVFGNAQSIGASPEDTLMATDRFRHLAVRGEGTIGVPWGSLYRRRVLTHEMFNLPKALYMGEDYIFWLRLVFATNKPVRLVYDNAYLKGRDTTSRTFRWTADYAQLIQHYRLQAVPESDRMNFLPDMISDRIANLFAVALSEPRHSWRQSVFYKDILCDMELSGISFHLKQKVFLNLPSRWLRRLYACLSNAAYRLRH